MQPNGVSGGTGYPVGPEPVKLASSVGATVRTEVNALSVNLPLALAAAQYTVTVLLSCAFGVEVCPRMVNGADRVTLSCST